MKTILTITALTVFSATANSALIISGISDGNESGGNPKSLEIYATTNIADLSAFYIARDTNGEGPWDMFVQLPNVGLTAGSFFYIASNTNSETYLNNAGFIVGMTNNVLNVSGDDIIGLATADNAGAVYDSVGVVAQGDTDFYVDSFAVRNNTSVTADITSTDGANFTITTWGDGSAFEGASGFGTFAPVPEPSSMTLLGLSGLALLRRRR